MQLSHRQMRMLHILTQQSSESVAIPITTAALAQKFGVSPRAIRYDLDGCAYFLKSHHMSLERHKTKGIKLVGSAEQLAELSQSLRQPDNISHNADTLARLIGFVLLCQETTSVEYLAQCFLLSPNKITKALIDTGHLLESMNLNLEKKPSLGLRVIGTELNIRLALLSLAQGLGEQTLVREQLSEPYSAVVRQVIHAYQAQTHVQFSDAGMHTLELVLCIQQLRMAMHKQVNYSTACLKKHLLSEGLTIAQACFESAGLSSPIEELLYASEHLHNTQMLSGPKQASETELGQEAHSLAYAFAKLATADLGFDFMDNPAFAQGLELHLMAAMYRLRQGNPMQNPLTEQIKYQYRYVFESSKKILQSLETQYNLQFTDDEISYVAMHVGACLDIEAHLGFTPQVILVCPAGLSSSKLLQTRLRLAVPELGILETVSVSGLSEQATHRADFIVSTVALPDLGKDVVVVNPLLPIEDIVRLKKQLYTHKNQKQLTHMASLYGTPEGRNHGSLLCEQGVQFLSASDWREAIRQAAEPLLSQGFIAKRYITAMIQAVETYGSYMVLFPDIAIVHASPTDGVHKSGLSLAVLDKPLLLGDSTQGAQMRLVFVLASAEEESHLFANLIQRLLDTTCLNALNQATTTKEVYALL